MFDLLHAEWFDSLPPVEVPVTLLWGGRDRVLDVSHIEEYERAIPNSRRRVVPHWGHYPMIEHPDGFAEVVAEVARTTVC